MLKRFQYVLVAAVAVIGIAVFFRMRQDTVPARAAGAATRAPETTVVQQGDLLITIGASGALQAHQTAALSFTATGKVASIAVEQGDHVLKGQIIATLDNTTPLNNVLLAQAKINSLQVVLHRMTDKPRQVDVTVLKMALNLAQAQLKAAQGSVDRIQAKIAQLGVDNSKNALWLQELTRDADKLKKNDLLGDARTRTQGFAMPSDEAENAALTQKGYDVDIAQANLAAAQSQSGNVGAITGAQAQVTVAQNALDKLLEGGDKQDIERTKINIQAAQFALDQAKATLDKTKLVAPFDGVIGKLNLNLGEQAPTNAPAAIILDTSAFYVDLPIDEVNVAKISVGQEADLTFAAFPGTILRGKVARIATSGQKVGGVVTYTIRIELDPSGKPLLSSMTAAVNIVTGKVSNVLLVPNRYIRVDGGKASAKVRQSDGTFQSVDVVVGLQNETVTEVKSGLHAGDVLTLP
jgi:HlyD family secretion protein